MRLLDGMRGLGEPFTQAEIESICRELFHNRGKISSLKEQINNVKTHERKSKRGN